MEYTFLEKQTCYFYANLMCHAHYSSIVPFRCYYHHHADAPIVKMDRKWQNKSGHSKGLPSRNDSRSLGNVKQGGMTQSVCIPLILTIAIACNVAPTASSLPPFVFMRGRVSTKSKTAVEGRVCVSCNSQVIETFWRGGKLPVGLAKGECTCVTLVIATP